MDEMKLLSLKEVAAMLGKHVQTVRRWKREGLLPVPLIGGRNPSWSVFQVRSWLQKNETRCVESDSN